jgi:hypothetical protein
MSALILIAETPEQTHTVRFTYADGRLTEAIEMIAGCLIELGATDSLYEGVAGDRLAIILRQREELKELRTWALLAGWCPPLKEAAR